MERKEWVGSYYDAMGNNSGFLRESSKQKCILNSLKRQGLKSENQLFKFHHKLTFQFQWELKKWLI